MTHQRGRDDRSTVSPVDHAAVVWLTGLSGSGKSTLGLALTTRLSALGVRVEYLDGDSIREVFPKTGFSRAERNANVKLAGYLASRLEAHGVTVVCALISPYAEARAEVRARCREFVEVYVSTPIEECERRDVKGLYARARQGELAQFTGVDDPYEPPLSPAIAIDTTHISVDDAVDRLLALLNSRAP